MGVIIINFVGRKIYYDKATGNVLVDTYERVGLVRQTTEEEDVAAFDILKGRSVESYDFIELKYGEYAQDFSTCNGYRVNATTSAIEFSYPNPANPVPQDPVYVKPLTDQIAELKQEVEALKAQVTTTTTTPA